MEISARITQLIRGAALAATITVGIPTTASVAQVAPAAPLTADRHYSTADTPIGVLLDDPAAKAVLDKHIPMVSKSSGTRMMRDATLKLMQGYALQVLTDQVLAAIDADLAKLEPMSAYVPSRMTTDEAKVRPYTLPDPLVLANGQPVRSARTWWNRRRPEIFRMFETLEFGKAPGRPADQRFEVFDKGTPAFGGKAIRRQITIHLARDPVAPQIQLVEYLPAASKGPVPIILLGGFAPPSAIFDDPGVRPGLAWNSASKSRVPAASAPMGKFDVAKFVDAGIGVASFYYADIDPDFPGGYPLGIRGFYAKGAEAERAPDAWGSIAAWGWAMSRVQDYLETDRGVNSRRVALVGASRLGKAVLWAGARDQRFAAVIACCSGKIGAGLMRRNFGSPIAGSFPGETDYWMAANFRQFYDREDTLPMDGHMLLALIAPRPVLLQTGQYDHAADPKGEFLAALAAGPVYRLLGKQDLGAVSWPPRGPILNDIGYSRNGGGHGPAPGDWDIYLAFLKKHLKF